MYINGFVWPRNIHYKEHEVSFRPKSERGGERMCVGPRQATSSRHLSGNSLMAILCYGQTVEMWITLLAYKCVMC